MATDTKRKSFTRSFVTTDEVDQVIRKAMKAKFRSYAWVVDDAVRQTYGLPRREEATRQGQRNGSKPR